MTYNVITDIEAVQPTDPKLSIPKSSKKPRILADFSKPTHQSEGLSGMFSGPGSSKYIKDESYQKHFEDFTKNDQRYDDGLVIEEVKHEDSFSEKGELIQEAHSYKHRSDSDSHQGFMNFTDFFKNIVKKKGEVSDSMDSTKDPLKTADVA